MRQPLIFLAIVFTLSACASSTRRAQRSEFEDIPVPKGLELVRVVPERVAMAVTGHVTRSMFDRYYIVSEHDLRMGRPVA